MPSPSPSPVIHTCPPHTTLPYFPSPSDLPSPLLYAHLPSPLISPRLAHLSAACTPIPGRAWAASFQPCRVEGEENQDRWVVEQWSGGEGEGQKGRWGFAGVWDGHVGWEGAEDARRRMPGMIREALFELLEANPSPSAEDVCALLEEQVQRYDSALTDALVALFPVGELETRSEAEVRERVERCRNGGGEEREAVVRCMRGTTAVLVLVDWERGELWCANVGDSEAVVASRSHSADTLVPTLLTTLHHPSTPSEASLLSAAHPSEPHCVSHNRVLGVLAVTRALGDHTFKLPAIYTRAVFLPFDPSFLSPHRAEKILAHSLSPPYVSALPSVTHRPIAPSDRYVVLFSDGLRDVWGGETERRCVESVERAREGDAGNRALRVIREAVGGADGERCAMMMGLELGERWMDDTTVVVLALH